MYKVLVCDDDDAILESILIYLTNEGYDDVVDGDLFKAVVKLPVA